MGLHLLNNLLLIPEQLFNNSYGLIKKIFFFKCNEKNVNFACNMQQ